MVKILFIPLGQCLAVLWWWNYLWDVCILISGYTFDGSTHVIFMPFYEVLTMFCLWDTCSVFCPLLTIAILELQFVLISFPVQGCHDVLQYNTNVFYLLMCMSFKICSFTNIENDVMWQNRGNGRKGTTRCMVILFSNLLYATKTKD